MELNCGLNKGAACNPCQNAQLDAAQESFSFTFTPEVLIVLRS